jgi:hypothetical protein
MRQLLSRLAGRGAVVAAPGPGGAKLWSASGSTAARPLISSRFRLEADTREIRLPTANLVRITSEDGGTLRRRSREDRDRETIIGELRRIIDAARRARAVALSLGAAEYMEAIERLARAALSRVSAAAASGERQNA